VSGTNGTPSRGASGFPTSGTTPLTNVVLSDASLAGFPDTALGTLEPETETSLYFESTLLASQVNAATVTAYSLLGALVMDTASATAQLQLPPDWFGDQFYAVTDLGTLGGTGTVARAINERSQAVGWSRTPEGRLQAFLWQNGVMTGLGYLPGASNSIAHAINNNGEITGRAYVSATNYHVFYFTAGSMSSIGTLGGPNGIGHAINDRGDLAGWSQIAGNSNPQGFFYRTNHFIQLPPWQETSYGNCEAFGMNATGRICGITYFLEGAGNARWWGFVWHDDNANGLYEAVERQTLGSLGTYGSAGAWSQATAINDSGQVVGATGITNDWFPRHAFLITPSGNLWKIPPADPNPANINPTNLLMQNLGTLDRPTDDSYANAINNRGWIVGTSTTRSGTNQAFLWRDGIMTNLNDLISQNSGWVLTNATGINEHGEIVGSGIFQGQERAYMLRTEGRITDVVPVIGISESVYTNELDQVITQQVEQVETQVIHWGGVWSTNREAVPLFTVEYCDALQDHQWQPFAPTSQWPIAGNFWTNTDFNAVSMRHFRVRAFINDP
jgi:probable HAF family extracellular repeat protein